MVFWIIWKSGIPWKRSIPSKAPDDFSSAYCGEYGGLYKIKLPPEALEETWNKHPDRDEIGGRHC